MEIDPTRWLVSLAGFTYDWIITREWKNILLSSLPVILLGTVASLVWWGQGLDRGELAQWYMQLGDEEIAAWEQAWAPATEGAADEMTAIQATEAGAQAEKESSEVSRFAEAIFRRVQLLYPSDRSQFVIGATLAQRGAIEQAKTMLSRIAPDAGRGYAPAHALLAQLYLISYQQQESPSKQQNDLLLHHISQAKQWERVPRVVLLAGYQLALARGDSAEALSLLAQSAERNPEDNYELTRLAIALKNDRVFERAWPKAEEFYRAEIESDPRNAAARIKLADLYILAHETSMDAQAAASDANLLGDAMDRAEKILREGEAIERTPEIVRGISEVYRIKFAKSLQLQSSGELSANIQLLDAAMRIDPTNPRVAEEVAKLARVGGQATDTLVDHLELFLVEGIATTATHTLLAEAHLVNHEFKEALPHLEQVVQRLPTAATTLNNLAFVVAELHPQRLDEALDYAQRAVAAAAAAKHPNADFYDTLGTVLSKLNRSKEAITAFEMAIELDRTRVDFHHRAALEYRRLGNDSMAEKHMQVIERLRSQAAAVLERQPSSASADVEESRVPTDGEPEASSPAHEADASGRLVDES